MAQHHYGGLDASQNNRRSNVQRVTYITTYLSVGLHIDGFHLIVSFIAQEKSTATH